MEEERRKIIVKEIEGWRRNRLLPEQYCDFLDNLYKDEEEEDGAKQILGLSVSKIRNGKPTTWLLLFGLIGLFFYIFYYFTSFPFPMQIAILALATLAFFWFGVRIRYKKPSLSLLNLSLGALIAPVGGSYLLVENDAAKWTIALVVAGSALFWMVTGLTSRFPVFHFAGWIAMGFIYGWILSDNIPEPGWAGLQISWLPASVLLAWFGWLMHHKSKQTGGALMAAGAVLWIAPELHGLFLTELSPWILQMILFAKLVAAATVLFASRNKWIEWVV